MNILPVEVRVRVPAYLIEDPPVPQVADVQDLPHSGHVARGKHSGTEEEEQRSGKYFLLGF